MAKARGGSATDSAAAAVGDAVLNKYTALVLRPAYATHAPPRTPDYRPQTGLLITRLTLALDRVVEPAVRRGLERAAVEAHGAFVTCVSQLHAEALPLL